ncbi:hypothetical protein A3A14_00155 [Candidatus Daviesbacteria bacterium RIFCSPLOWO2_01_FULL_43_38]|uniref:Glycosyltransferase RgtA/B/C/D-like domain-containing protein n=1 Tax=Candidatus Daviesbacteria bacterium RIFCSPHIGHO2_12_FULL_43_11 TaxID=1797780 RepID=A0A1F5K4Q9_9BACT|nr:MAG: hypothetical protein A2874_00795 [Candidatus Daviesbacteria bacterium RIFCSPHIGHO2_01_FULL_43_17]OGE35758.1 MAG: hypothetical protein A3E45_00480 [Candidatus Daviesbacteria bacterium RIFCSPHIGHO2_12_FULL_43_11]OGE63443.1 MAG: hypothetical protein A3A14_00155 [Candidatus Daviesbacteria bacterium RIFCSPLOWO2_01_FULL_43_38]
MRTKKAVLFLIIIGVVVYFNSLFNGFVWDDEEQVLNNVLVHSITNLPAFFSGSTFNTGGSGGMGGLYYKPLMPVSFSLLYSIFGPNPFFFHLFQVSLHIANAILVFLLFRHFFKGLAFFPALIFLIHPINVEAVVYSAALQDTLFLLFGMLALLFTVNQNLGNLKNACILAFLLTLSLLSKETGVVFIILTILYAAIFKKREVIASVIAVLTTASIYSLLRFGLAGIFFNKHGLSPITILSFPERLQSIPKVIYFYLKTTVFPYDLAISQHWVVKTTTFNDFYLPLILITLVGLIFLFVFFFLRHKHSWNSAPYLFFLAWFILGIGIHAQIVPLDMTVADRWFYAPIVGLLGMAGIVLNELRVKSAEFRIVGLILITLLITGLSARTMVRNTNWKDGLTLYGHDIQITRDNFDLENNFGVELYRAGRFDEAEAHFQKSTVLAPQWWTNWNNLGAIVERKGDYQKAKGYYQKAVDNGSYYLAYENLANIHLFRDNNPQKAKEFTEDSLQKLPLNPKLWLILALSEYQLGNTQKALEASRQAYSLSQTEQTFYVYSHLSHDLPLEIK